MGNAYAQPISTHPEPLHMPMHGYALVAAAEAQGDEQIGELVRAGRMRIWDTVHMPLGADVNGATSFLAHGTPIDTLTAIGLPPDCREARA
jgi:hypothetical protein